MDTWLHKSQYQTEGWDINVGVILKGKSQNRLIYGESVETNQLRSLGGALAPCDVVTGREGQSFWGLRGSSQHRMRV